jgi:hypothetical protein
MLFDGQNLRELILRSPNEIELRNQQGRCCRILSTRDALALDLDLFIGVGNLRRVKFLRPRTIRWFVASASTTTQRLTDSAGLHFSHPLIREHRPMTTKPGRAAPIIELPKHLQE